ncbi:hypothetical protein FVR03_23825 [Pontibacter qinzhouensis]|uniref:Uncharacterized protein n=1 Tax=Pontibacter qinzhouensis TaxID=2603253 RepID=A0A5C8IJ51_9BACT|nr:hypothetical protein [Pontibacter qinzhouensis]TXK20956.1 hypothetical protein FVR03_23825 [Pontibacter qinzhouensis]
MMLMMLGVSLIIIYVWYSIFEKPKIRLKQDLEKGIKVTQAATVNKIKNKKEGKSYLMSNGLEVKESDFEDENLIEGSVEEGIELIITYTSYHKMILNIKSKSTALNQI